MPELLSVGRGVVFSGLAEGMRSCERGFVVQGGMEG
jgi:hypothetical protein